jgi:hypothetical protein
MPARAAKIKLVPVSGYVGRRRQFFDMLAAATRRSRGMHPCRAVFAVHL